MSNQNETPEFGHAIHHLATPTNVLRSFSQRVPRPAGPPPKIPRGIVTPGGTKGKPGNIGGRPPFIFNPGGSGSISYPPGTIANALTMGLPLPDRAVNRRAIAQEQDESFVGPGPIMFPTTPTIPPYFI